MVEGAAKPRVPSPEKERHRSHPQEAADRRGEPREAVIGEREKHHQVAEKEQKSDYQPEPDTHPQGRVPGGQMGQPHQKYAEQEEYQEVKSGVLGDGLRHDVIAGRGISSHEYLTEHVRRMQGLTFSDIHDEVPHRDDRCADQSGERSFSENRMFPSAHVGLRPHGE